MIFSPIEDTKPTFSIIVPIYNEERYIREALDSILSQTDPDWEAILVNDGSTDASPEIIEEYAGRDARFRVFHKPNGGQSSAINKGVSEARGDWLCWLSGDDYFHPEKLELNRQWIQQNPQVKFFFSGFWLIDEKGNNIEVNLDYLELEIPSYHIVTLFRTNYICGINICILREAWLIIGEFSQALRYAHDLDMWLRLIVKVPTQYFKTQTCTMRYHPEQETSLFPLGPRYDAARVLINFTNQHNLEDLFTKINWGDREIVFNNIRKVIDFVICEYSSNIYALGVNLLLFLRLLDWLFNTSNSLTLKKDIIQYLKSTSLEMMAIYQQTPFGVMWKAINTANIQKDFVVRYYPYDAGLFGKIYYYQQNNNYDIQKSLQVYLKDSFAITLENTITINSSLEELVLLLPQDIDIEERDTPLMAIVHELISQIIRLGIPTTILGKSKYTIGLFDGIVYLGYKNDKEQKQLLSNLGFIDTFVVISRMERMNWGRSLRSYYFEFPDSIPASLGFADSLISKINTYSISTIDENNVSKLLKRMKKTYKKKYYKIKRSIRLVLK